MAYIVAELRTDVHCQERELEFLSQDGSRSPAEAGCGVWRAAPWSDRLKPVADAGRLKADSAGFVTPQSRRGALHGEDPGTAAGKRV